MTCTQMIVKILTRLNLAASNPFFTSAQLLALLNDGYKNFCARTLALKKFVLIDIVADQTEYDLPDDHYKVLWLGYDDEAIAVVSADDLDYQDENWIGRSGMPYAFVEELAGLTQIKLHLTPGTSSTALSDDTTAQTSFESWVDNLLLYHAYEPADMVAGSTPSLETSYQWALIYYVLWKAFDQEGEFKDSLQAEFYKARYESYVKKKSEFFSPVEIGSGSEPDPAGEILDWNQEEIEYELKDIEFLTIADDGRLSFGDHDDNGTWKMARSGNDLTFEKRESGAYVEKGALEP